MIDISQGTPEYDQELFNKCNTFFDRGCAHILRQFHQYIYDKTLMCQAYVGTYADPRFRDGCDLVPYTEDELKEITDLDRSEGRVWNPPPLISPNLEELVIRVRRTRTAESSLVPCEVNPFVGDHSTDAGQTPVENPIEE